MEEDDDLYAEHIDVGVEDDLIENGEKEGLDIP
jgi:hypothetical protein